MEQPLPITKWHPTTVKEMQRHGWEKPDVVFFSGDAYVDHPSFGTAMIARVMESAGMVAVVLQPNWQMIRDLKSLRTKYFRNICRLYGPMLITIRLINAYGQTMPTRQMVKQAFALIILPLYILKS